MQGARGPGAPSVRGVRLQPPPWHGINLAGWFVAGAPPAHLAAFIQEADFARLASWRFTHVRLPVAAGLLDHPAALGALDGALAACERYRLRCVLALTLDPQEQAALFAPEPGWPALVERWEGTARRYAGQPDGLCYDLLDQPSAPDGLPPDTLAALGAARLSPAAARRPAAPGAIGGRAWNALAARLTQAIRAVDERHTLVVQANQAAGAGGPAGFTHLRPTRDQNTLYSFHWFEPRGFTHQEAQDEGQEGSSRGTVTYPGVVDGERWDKERLARLLEPVVEFGRIYEAPLYLGAFGASAFAPRSGQLTWVRSALSLCRAHGIGWAYWTYRTYQGRPFGLVCDSDDPGSGGALPQYQNPQRLDYDLLGILQSEA